MPLVSIICLTYNQVKYIKQCLDSFLMQKTNFKFEILIHDDASTDGTKEIIEEYVKNYPDIIKTYYENENQYSKGNIIKIIKNLYSNANSKYVAQCEGDDFWTDTHKLQKQVDFMEKHPDYSICFHKVKMIFENVNKSPKIVPAKTGKYLLSYKKMIQQGFMPSNSIMFRFDTLKDVILNYPENIYPADWFTNIMVAKHGKIGFINEVMAVYRRNEGGISFTTEKDHQKELHKRYGLQEMNFFYEVWQRIKDIYPEYYNDMFLPNLRDIYFTYLQMGDFEKLEILKNKYSQYFKDMQSSTGIASKKHKKYKKMFNISLIINIILAVFLIGLALSLILKII